MLKLKTYTSMSSVLTSKLSCTHTLHGTLDLDSGEIGSQSQC